MIVWLNKKVFIETFSNKVFIGRIIDETDTKFILIDKFNHQVELTRADIKTCKEEF